MQTEIEKEALSLLKENRDKGRKFLTDYTIKWGDKVVKRAWRLGDELWTKYDEKF